VNDRIKSKHVGQVNICEISGDFRSQFARRGKVALAQLAHGTKTSDLFVNLCALQGIDAFGLDVLVESSSHFLKSALLFENSPAKGNLDRSKLEPTFHFVRDCLEAADYFSSEFAKLQPGVVDGEERRGFIRLPTVLPAQFTKHDGADKSRTFFSVVTNLSEGGLYAEFIDSDTETCAAKNLDPLELILLDLRLVLAPGVVVKAGAKVLHTQKDGGGIGMEFYQFHPGDKEKLMEWLARQVEGGKAFSETQTGLRTDFQGGVHS